MELSIAGDIASNSFHFGDDYIREHFGSNTALAVQQATQNLYRINPEPLVDHLYRCLMLTGRESIIDIGCGNGFILRDIVSRMRYGGSAVAVDISEPMLELAERNVSLRWIPVTFTAGDARRLDKFANDSFDRVMANYIFHYIDEPDVVLSEMRRLLSPGGRAVVTIEARTSMSQMYQLHFECMAKAGLPADFIARLPRGRRGVMTLENTRQYLEDHFEVVQEYPYFDALRFTQADQFMSFYVDGHRYCGALPNRDETTTDAMFETLRGLVEQRVNAEIERVGYFELSKQNSVFACQSR